MSLRRFVAFPGLLREESGDSVRLRNPVHGTEVEGDKDLLELLALFAEPITLAQVREHVDLDEEDLAPLIGRHVLVDNDELAFLRAGFLNVGEGPTVGARCEWAELLERAAPGDRVVFGAPVDVAAGGKGGARHGPRELRHAAPRWLKESDGLAREVLHIDLGRHYHLGERRAFDVGNVELAPDEAYSMLGHRIQKLVTTTAEADLVPIMLGGDHSVSWFALRPLLERHPKLGVIHFDAHHDLYPTSDGKLRHLNPFDFVCQHDSLALLLQIGLRTSEAVPRDAAPVVDKRIRCVSAMQLQHKTAEQVLGDLPRDIPYYLSFDVDCLDPSIAPETGTTVVGGVGYYQALSLIDYAARYLHLVGADFVEVTDSDRRVNMAAHIVGEYLGLCVLGDAPFGPIDTYYYRR